MLGGVSQLYFGAFPLFSMGSWSNPWPLAESGTYISPHEGFSASEDASQ